MRRLSSRMATGSLLVLELHRIDLLMDNFSKLDIKYRQKKLTESSSVRCYWPSGPIVWDSHQWYANMPIKIEILDDKNSKVLHAYETCSGEYIHTQKDVAGILSTLPFQKLDKKIVFETPNAHLMVYRKCCDDTRF